MMIQSSYELTVNKVDHLPQIQLRNPTSCFVSHNLPRIDHCQVDIDVEGELKILWDRVQKNLRFIRSSVS